MSTTLLEVSQVSKRYAGLAVLTDVSLKVPEGAIVGLIGPNGAGKSTLMGVISGYIPPDSGDVLLSNERITQLPAHVRCRRGIARTFQHSQTFASMRVVDSLALGALLRHRPKKAVHDARGICERLGLDPHAMPDKLTPRERSLLELGRAVMTEARVMLLDEVMAGMTEQEEDDFIHTLNDFRSDTTGILFVEHNIPVIRRLCDYVYVLSEGHKIAQGIPEAVLADPVVVESYLGA